MSTALQHAQDFAVSFPEREGRDLPAAAVATQVRGSCPWQGAVLGGWGGASPTPGCLTQVGACLLHRGPPVGKNDQLRFLYLFDSNAKHASWYVDLILFLPVNPYQNLVAVCWFLESGKENGVWGGFCWGGQPESQGCVLGKGVSWAEGSLRQHSVKLYSN